MPNEIPSYDFVFRHATTGMAFIAADGTLLKVNAALCDLLGYDQNELKPPSPPVRTLLLHIHEKAQVLTALPSTKSTPLRFELNYHHPSGNCISLMISITVLRENNEALPYIWAQFENHTMIRQLETQLQLAESNILEKERDFMQLLEELPQVVLITKKGIIQYTNSAGLQLIHAGSLDRVLGLSTTDLIDPSNYEILNDRRKKFYSGKSVESVCYLINCLNGQQKYVEGISLPIIYEGARAVMGIFSDVSQQLLEDERLIQSEKLSTAGLLAAGIAHEIRNPLTAINGFMKLLHSSERINYKYLSIIESELKRIELIVNELLVLSKPQTTHISKAVNFIPLLEQVITLMSGQALLRNINILPVCKDESIWLYGEAYQLKQVFINLLKNAIEAMNNGGNIYIDVLTNDTEACISVKDEGSGMTEDQIKDLGKPFYTTKETGTGLGFMITQNIVHNHGGTITVESIPEQGTTFTVIIPMIIAPEEVT